MFYWRINYFPLHETQTTCAAKLILSARYCFHENSNMRAGVFRYKEAGLAWHAKRIWTSNTRINSLADLSESGLATRSLQQTRAQLHVPINVSLLNTLDAMPGRRHVIAVGSIN